MLGKEGREEGSEGGREYATDTMVWALEAGNSYYLNLNEQVCQPLVLEQTKG